MKTVFEVGDSVKSVLVKTHGKEGVVASVDGKEESREVDARIPTEETSRRLVHAADYQPSLHHRPLLPQIARVLKRHQHLSLNMNLTIQTEVLTPVPKAMGPEVL